MPMLSNGLAHLPPVLARQLTLKTTFSTKWPPHPSAEGGQVEPVLGLNFFPSNANSSFQIRATANCFLGLDTKLFSILYQF
jgi:hypothetical protein